MPKYILKHTRKINGKVFEGTPDKPVEVELPAGQRFVIRSSRYVNDEFVAASPQFPAVITLAPGEKIDPHMFLEEEPAANAKLKPHYVARDEKPVPHSATPSETKGKRDSDKDVA